ncbi:uncharacterized protein TNCV_928841 [Trichonephila clavipes]|nr:uncharacterized protein TNCV_928841 [Trichonephila clavipes]
MWLSQWYVQCSHMGCPSCNDFQEPFFNKTMLGLTQKGCYKAVSALLLPFLSLPDPQFVTNRAYLRSFGSAIWASHEFERTRGKVTTNMKRNVSRHTELGCLNARSYRIVHSR